MGYSYQDPSQLVCSSPPPEALVCSAPESNAAAVEALTSHGGGEGHEGGEHDPLHPVHQVVNGIETAHTALEMAEIAHTGAELGHGLSLAEHAHEAGEILTGETAMSGAAMGTSALGAVLAPVSIGMGANEIYNGVEHGDAYDIAHGTAGVAPR